MALSPQKEPCILPNPPPPPRAYWTPDRPYSSATVRARTLSRASFSIHEMKRWDKIKGSQTVSQGHAVGRSPSPGSASPAPPGSALQIQSPCAHTHTPTCTVHTHTYIHCAHVHTCTACTHTHTLHTHTDVHTQAHTGSSLIERSPLVTGSGPTVPQRTSYPCPYILKAIFLSTSDGITRNAKTGKVVGRGQ